MFSVNWMDEGGEVRVEMFSSEDEAAQAARDLVGISFVVDAAGGTPTVFRNGQELAGPDASDSFEKFGRRIEVGVSRPGEPETNVDPDDTTGSGWRQGTPDVYGWRVGRPGEASSPWLDTYWSPEAAVKAAEEARAEQAKLAWLPIIRIDR